MVRTFNLFPAFDKIMPWLIDWFFINIEINEIQAAGICLGFFVEAYETSANALSVALYQLAKNPHILDELVRTIEESIAANNNEITFDLVQKHEYLERVLFGKIIYSM